MKRTLGVVVKIVIVLSMLFLATGLLVKEVTYQVTIDIDTPADSVFSKFSNQQTLNEWVPDIASSTTIVDRKGSVGHIYEKVVVSKESNESYKMSEKVLAFVVNKKITYYRVVDDMVKTDDYRFEESKGKTKIIQTVVCRSNNYLLQCVLPYFKGKFVEIDQNYLNNFKAYIENK